MPTHSDQSHIIRGDKPHPLANFAQHYQIKYASCGSDGCITANILDPISNKVVSYYPDAYIMIDDDEHKEFVDDYKLESNLLMIQGVSSIDLVFRRSYYEFKNNKLILINEEQPTLND